MSMKGMVRGALALMMVLAGSSAAAAQTGGGDAQLLVGTNFRDTSVGNATTDGMMSTLTLEHFGGWALGDQFFFIDLMTGTFEETLGRGYRMYAEWTPRLSLSKVSDRNLGLGPVTDVLLVGEVHGGSGGYAAGLLGAGADLRVPGFNFATVSLLRRDDVFSAPTWQASGVWSAPLPLGLPGRIDGFIDVMGAPGGGATVMTQPQLLVEVGRLVGSPRRDVEVGVEWYLHSDGERWHSVPQALFRWGW